MPVKERKRYGLRNRRKMLDAETGERLDWTERERKGKHRELSSN
jgi:hypothetical protein